MRPPLDFDGDETKARSKLAKHKISFEYATRVFAEEMRLDFDASHERDGEARRKAIGRTDGKLMAVVYVVRNGVVRIISARRANKKEERRFGQI